MKEQSVVEETTADDPSTGERTKTVRYTPPPLNAAETFARTGLEQLRAIVDGSSPLPPISGHIGLKFVRINEGDVLLTAQPDESLYNPIGSVHGGFAATLLDSACGVAVHSTLAAGVGYTTLDLTISFLRPITLETGTVAAHGWTTRSGRRAAFAEADIRDVDGRVLATASSTCLIMPLQ